MLEMTFDAPTNVENDVSSYCPMVKSEDIIYCGSLAMLTNDV